MPPARGVFLSRKISLFLIILGPPERFQGWIHLKVTFWTLPRPPRALQRPSRGPPEPFRGLPEPPERSETVQVGHYSGIRSCRKLDFHRKQRFSSRIFTFCCSRPSVDPEREFWLHFENSSCPRVCQNRGDPNSEQSVQHSHHCTLSFCPEELKKKRREEKKLAREVERECERWVSRV